jgi:hypothetical protein
VKSRIVSLRETMSIALSAALRKCKTRLRNGFRHAGKYEMEKGEREEQNHSPTKILSVMAIITVKFIR